MKMFMIMILNLVKITTNMNINQIYIHCVCMHIYKTVGGSKAKGDCSESGESTGSNAGDAQYHPQNESESGKL